MYKNLRLTVVIPCFNEERQLPKVLASMPPFVDDLVVVDDGSTDRTAAVTQDFRNKDARIVLIRHEVNQGVGAAIASGYQWAQTNRSGIAVVMAGDAQMNPEDLTAILDPVAEGRADYCKGNRFTEPSSRRRIPRARLLGNEVLSFLTRLISGYWHISDTQNGYTAMNARVLQALDWSRMYKGYGQPNDLLVRLSLHRFRVAEVPHKAVYGGGEQSKMKIPRVIFPISLLLLKLAFLKIRTRVCGPAGPGSRRQESFRPFE